MTRILPALTSDVKPPESPDNRWSTSLASEAWVCALLCARCWMPAKSLQQHGDVRKQRRRAGESFQRPFLLLQHNYKLYLLCIFDQRQWKSSLDFCLFVFAFLWRLIGRLWTQLLLTSGTKSTTRIHVKLVLSMLLYMIPPSLVVCYWCIFGQQLKVLKAPIPVRRARCLLKDKPLKEEKMMLSA